MLSFPASVRIYIAPGVTDMRKSFDGLCAVTKSVLDEDPFSGHVFAFCNRRRDRLKLLLWDRHGFWVFAKRLEEGTFAWPSAPEDRKSLLVTTRELMCAIEGLEPRFMSRRKRFSR